MKVMDVQDELKEKLAIGRKLLSQERNKNINWLSKNRFLAHRSRQLAKIKLDSHFSSRTVLMMDAANFSDFFGYVDEVLLDTELKVVDFPNDAVLQIMAVTSRFQIIRTTLKNGEFAALKQFKTRARLTEAKCLTHLSYEAKILSLVGYHNNVVYCHGIALVDSAAAIVLSYESDATLDKYLKRNPSIKIDFIQRILSGASEGILHIHRKGVLHNQVIPQNICLRYKCQFYEPVLVGFSSACRADNSKPLTLNQQERFKDVLHLPRQVKSGHVAPSFASDVYSFGDLCRKFALRHSNHGLMGENEVFKLASECLKDHPSILGEFEDVVDFYLMKLK